MAIVQEIVDQIDNIARVRLIKNYHYSDFDPNFLEIDQGEGESRCAKIQRIS